MGEDLGLRERKKLATRTALSRAAWTLLVEQGMDAVTPDAVAEAADVSPRTFRNYFDSREEAIFYSLVRGGEALVDKVRARPADEPVWDSLMAVLPDAAADIVGSRKELVVLMGAIKDNPALRAQHLVAFERARWIEDIIAERTGTDAARDLRPRLMAGVVAVALRKSIELWAEGAVDTELPDLVREALAELRAGLPIAATV